MPERERDPHRRERDDSDRGRAREYGRDYDRSQYRERRHDDERYDRRRRDDDDGRGRPRERSGSRERRRSYSPDDRSRRRERQSGFSQRISGEPDGNAAAAAHIPGGTATLAHAAAVTGSTTGVDPVTQALLLQAMLQQQPQSSKSSRELYVGNLPAGGVLTELTLKDYISAAVMQAGLNIQPGSPVMQARINGCYAFIEFRSVQECTNALSLRGIILSNNELTVDRPMAYRGPPDGIVITWPMVMAAKIAECPDLEREAIGLRPPLPPGGLPALTAGLMPLPPAPPGGGGGLPGLPGLPGLLAMLPQPPFLGLGAGAGGGGGGGAVDQAAKAQRELHIGNIPEGTHELELKLHLEAVVAAAGMRDAGLGAGPVVLQVRCSAKFAFAEFRSVGETSALMALDGSMFKGNTLRVQRPRAYVPPAGAAPPQSALAAAFGVGGGGGGFGGGGLFGLGGGGLPLPPPPPPGLADPSALYPPSLQPPSAPPPAPATSTLELSNMCTAGEVATEQDVAEVREDTHEEMAKYGAVRRLEVVRPPASSAPSTQVFLLVRFDSLEAARTAHNALQGRTFDGRVVGVRYIGEEEFEARAAAEERG